MLLHQSLQTFLNTHHIQDQQYKNSVMSPQDWFDSMIITNTSLSNMRNWIKHPLVKEYSLSPDWDDRWRFGGNLKEVIDEARLSSNWQLKAIEKFTTNRDKRLETLKNMIPKD